MTATARPRCAARGVTLVELLVSLVIGSIVIAGAFGLLTSQQRAFRSSAADRAMQDGARTALAELSTNLRRAGYGIEPWLAFDLGPVQNAPPSWTGAPVSTRTTTGYPAGPPGAALPGCNPVVAPSDRDSITGPDEIVFHARDPGFNRQLASAPSASMLKFTTALTTPLEKGQILQVMCGGAAAWAYVTVGTRADKDATQVALATNCTNAFPYQQDLLTTGCFAAGFAAVRVFKIERFHYYVDRFQGRPYLMLDRGLWNDVAALVEPVAPDVEDIQFAYVFPANALAPVVGATPGTQLTATAAGIDLAAAPPSYGDPTISATRTTHHPANIQAVRLSVVLRSSSADAQLTAAEFNTIPAAANRPALTATADPSYRRLIIETTEATRNLGSRGPYYPTYSTNNGADGLNVGGG